MLASTETGTSANRDPGGERQNDHADFSIDFAVEASADIRGNLPRPCEAHQGLVVDLSRHDWRFCKAAFDFKRCRLEAIVIAKYGR